MVTRQHASYQSYSFISLSNFLQYLTLELTHLHESGIRHHKILGSSKFSSLSADGWFSSLRGLEKSDPLRCSNKIINFCNNYATESASIEVHYDSSGDYGRHLHTYFHLIIATRWNKYVCRHLSGYKASQRQDLWLSTKYIRPRVPRTDCQLLFHGNTDFI